MMLRQCSWPDVCGEDWASDVLTRLAQQYVVSHDLVLSFLDTSRNFLMIFELLT